MTVLRGKRATFWLMLLFAVVGAFIGNRVGEAVQASLPALARSGSFTVEPGRFALLDVAVTFGVSLRMNVAGALGALAGILLARRV